MEKKNPPRAKKVDLAGGEEPKRGLLEVRPQLDALREDELQIVNIDPMKAGAIVLAAEPRAQAVIAPVLDQLPNFDPRAIQLLRPTALAMVYVETALAAERQDADLKAMVTRALAIRRDYLFQADGLVHRGLLPPEPIAEVRDGRGNLDLAHDVLKLIATFRGGWAKIEGKTPITLAELEAAEKEGMKLVEALGAREGGVVAAVDAETHADLRTRAFTLLSKRYDEVRRAVTYLRWHEGDADEITPSFYVGSRGGPRRPAGPNNGTGDLPGPADVAPGPAGDPSSAGGDDDVDA